MEIQLLGGLSVQLLARELDLGTPKQQAVFAMLAVQPGQLVTLNDLIDELWPDGPPRSAVANVRTYAANLRRTFEACESGRGVIVRQQSGYRLALGPEVIDVFRFDLERGAGREALTGGHLDRARELLERALARWQGPMLAGVPLGPVLTSRTVAAEEERLLTVELLADVQLRSGRGDLAISLLREIIARQPLREPAYGLLMRALYSGGDRSGALVVHGEIRAKLATELGVEPGSDIQGAYQMIIKGAAEAESTIRVPPRPIPERRLAMDSPDSGGATNVDERHRRVPVDHLPRSVTDFVGRKELVSRLLAETRRVEDRVSAVHVIDGMAGSGKTTLAVHLARRLSARYRDARLFIDLCGDGETTRIGPSAALVTLLRQLHVPAERIPIEFDARVELWRRELESRRVVVVFDNAAGSDQVLPLLPASQGAVVLVTSRRRLVDLDVGPPASLPLMTLDEGLELLAQTAGVERIAEEPAAAAEVVRRCGYLPLAIRLAGSRLAHRPARRVEELADLLAADPPALNQLQVGDRTLARAFATSYGPLPAPAKRAFRMLSIHPGELSVEMVAALVDLPLDAVGRLLDDLVDLHLVDEVAGGRYRLHDLLRQYSRAQCLVSETSEAITLAVARLLDFALHATLHAASELHQSTEIREEVEAGPPPRPDLIGPETVSGVDWLEQERTNLGLLVSLGAEHGMHQQVWKLARALWRFLHVRGHFDDILVTHRAGLASATELQHRPAIVSMHNYLASALVKTGSHRLASTHLDAAISLCRESGDWRQLARLRSNLSVVHLLSGELEQAVAMGRQSLAERRLYDNRVPLALPNLGIALASLGRWEEAAKVHRQHLFQARLNQDYYHLANALSHLAAVRVRVGQYRQSVALLKSSLSLFRRTGHRYGEAEARNILGVAYRGLNKLDLARGQHLAAFELAVESGERHAQCIALNDLGSTLLASGDGRAASEAHRRGLQLAERISNPHEQGRALAGLAEYFVRVDPVEARRHWERALAIFRRMGVPERFEAERRLAELPDPTPVAEC
ncbi:BTAD domain-containing putative transcriptional regulator [Micromonospora sp. NPDC005220]|uniref:AfsR/SARP family transcriptional regulator n=1 Tax=Micromonospora sp. NPDC005220 TaxID=3155589 RepID=UPI00339F1D6C